MLSHRFSLRTLRIPCAWLTALLWVALSPAFADVLPASLVAVDERSATLTIENRTWTLIFDDVIAQRDPITNTASEPQQLSGTVTGSPESWFTLTIYQWPNDVAGVVSAFHEWFQLETSETAKHLLRDSPATDSNLVAIRPDVNTATQTTLVDTILPLPNVHSFTPLRSAIKPRTTIERLTTKALRVGVIVDSRFNEHHNGRGVARAKAIMAGVDAILRQELGLAIEVDTLVDYSEPDTDPFRTLEANINDSVMPALQAERVDNENLSDDLALVHLFSGHHHQNVDTIVGLGWLNGVCNPNGFDVSVSTPYLFDTLLAAHEILHNLGAPHDDSEQCAAYPETSANSGETAQFLMNTRISSNTASRLSRCSIALTQASPIDQCAVQAIDFETTIGLLPGRNSNESFVRIKVTNQDTARSVSDAFSVIEFPDGVTVTQLPDSCEQSLRELRCQHSSVGPKRFEEFELGFELNAANDARIRAEVKLERTVDPVVTNNVAVANVSLNGTTVLPAFNDDDQNAVNSDVQAVNSNTDPINQKQGFGALAWLSAILALITVWRRIRQTNGRSDLAYG